MSVRYEGKTYVVDYEGNITSQADWNVAPVEGLLPGSKPIYQQKRTDPVLLLTVPVTGHVDPSWRALVDTIFPKSSHHARMLWKEVMRIRHSRMAKGWRDVLEPGIAKWADATLHQSSKMHPCVDNFRAARIGNTGQMRRYKQQKARGCCGSHDFKAFGPDGCQYLLGFNYGH